MSGKEDVRPEVLDLGNLSAESQTSSADAFGSNDIDKLNMQRMGKDQEMNRVFRQMGTWQWMLLANSQGLIAGGRGGIFWSYIWTFAGYALLAASLADMAAMAPTAGGQYHWVSEFAPPRFQQVLSYTSGWLASLSWQAGNASGLFLCASIIQSLISITNPDYAAPAWQCWLLTIAMTAICVVFNIWFEKILPVMQNMFFPVYIVAFIATVAVMASPLVPHVDAKTAFLEFTDEGGWSSMVLAVMVGQISAIFALGGCDAAAHMSEECQNASLSVPRAMVGSNLINSAMGFIALITFLFAVPSVDDAVNDPSGFPLVYVLNQAGSPGLTIGLIFLQLLLLMVGNVAYQASTARQTFAFARDGGMPFSRWIGHVNTKYHLPVNAVLLTAAITILLALIDIGSSDAFNAILSLAAVAQMASYSISISCVLYRRITAPHLLPKGSWGLGKWGIPVNTLGALYAWFAFFWSFWPGSVVTDAQSMNYAVVMFGGVVILALVFFVVKAGKTYAGPVTRTEGFKQG